MGKPTGFIEYLRELPGDPLSDGAALATEGIPEHMDRRSCAPRRALHDCGLLLPYRKLISCMASGCTVNNLISPSGTTWFTVGLCTSARRLHRRTRSRVTAAFCPAPCEALGPRINTSRSLSNIETRIIDRGCEEGWSPTQAPKFRTAEGPVSAPPRGRPPPRRSTAPATPSLSSSAPTVRAAMLIMGIPTMKLDNQEVVLRRISSLSEGSVHLQLPRRHVTRITSSPIKFNERKLKNKRRKERNKGKFFKK